MSKHGDQCNTDYPNANQTVREAFWAQFQQLFDGMLFDTRAGLVNETTLSTLVAKNMRMVVYESPGNFSGGSPYSQDGCTIDNDGDGIQRAGFEQSIDVVQGLFANVSVISVPECCSRVLPILVLGLLFVSGKR